MECIIHDEDLNFEVIIIVTSVLWWKMNNKENVKMSLD